MARDLDVSFTTFKRALDILKDEGLIVTKVGQGTFVAEAGRAEIDWWDGEVRLRDLVEFGSDILWEMDLNSVYTYCSPNVAPIMGYVPYEVVGKTPFDFMPPEETDRVRDLLTDIVAERGHV